MENHIKLIVMEMELIVKVQYGMVVPYINVKATFVIFKMIMKNVNNPKLMRQLLKNLIKQMMTKQHKNVGKN